jgi:ComF family protein
MHLWKYQPRPSAGRLLSDRMENWLQQQTLPEVDAVLAIPMHPKKLAQRGFNTAYQLARLVAETQSLPLLHHALVRQFATPAQAGLSKQARQQNLLGVFRVDTQRMMGYQRILLVDDVLTTGSTLTACTQLLHTAGVREIAVLTLARALPKNDVTAV